MKWTKAQQQTIETRDRNILVSAAAGSGKTTVLIERIKRLVLEDHTDIDRFLITTFTNAAAAEMKEKMERAINEEIQRLQEENREDMDFLQRQLELLPRASISTFHTFAIGIMQDFFFLTDLQPGFAVGDETQLSIMRSESMDEVFENRFEEDPQRFRAFLRCYSGDRNDERLKEHLLSIYQEMRSIPRYMQWARERTACLKGEDPVGELGIDRFLLEETADALGDAVHWYEAAAQILARPETESIGLKARQDAAQVDALRTQAEEALQAGTSPQEALAELGMALDAFKPNQMRAAKAESDAFAAVKDEVGRLRKEGKKHIDSLRKKYYSQSIGECNRILQAVAEDTAYAAELIGQMEEIYREKKQDQNIVDFDDCMHYAIAILEDEQAAAEYRERFRYIFIDEYQDSNLLQEEIVGQIAREDNLFLVGDVKQSIYKFRLAEPEIFRRRYEEYRSGQDEHSIRIDLNSNFRSRRTIRDAVNRIFEKIMDGYDEDASLKGPEEEERTGYPVSLHILDKAASAAAVGSEEQADPEEEEPSGGDYIEELTEYEIIADIIRDSLGKPIAGRDGTIRPIEYGDIAVLSRGGRAIPQIERYLNNEGIPAFGETAGGYYETVEIQVFLNLLKLISNPSQDIPLISSMSSVVFDFTPYELAQIRIECREGSFYDAVCRYETEGKDEGIREKIRDMFGRISRWKEIGRTLPLDELMRRLLYDTGYYDYCSGLPTGQQRISNLRLLLEKAAAYEESSHLGLYGFLSYVDAMRRTKQKVSEASLMGEGRSVVHVMTVHKSKGLEFPVVILAGAGSKITGSSAGRAPVMHKSFAIGLAEVDRDHHWERKTILQKAIAGKKSREDLEEEIRILYVALTRPMEKLAIVGTVRDEEHLQRFAGKGSFLEMIYGTLCEMEEEDPSKAAVIVHGGRQQAGEGTVEETEPQRKASKQEASDPQTDRPEADRPQAAADPALIHARLSYQYPHTEEQLVRSKYAVTEIVRRSHEGAEGSEAPEHPESYRPEVSPRMERPTPALRTLEEIGAAPEERRLTAAEVGTAMHTVMERIDFAAALEKGVPYIQEVADALRQRGILTEAEHAVIRPQNIDGFFHSPLGARAARADLLRKEKEFLLRREIDGVPTIVQGIIDCYFEDEEGLVLIDYKNSWADGEESEAEVIQRYAGQIRLYREALEQALGKPVDEAWLYLFRSRKFISAD